VLENDNLRLVMWKCTRIVCISCWNCGKRCKWFYHRLSTGNRMYICPFRFTAQFHNYG